MSCKHATSFTLACRLIFAKNGRQKCWDDWRKVFAAVDSACSLELVSVSIIGNYQSRNAHHSKECHIKWFGGGQPSGANQGHYHWCK